MTRRRTVAALLVIAAGLGVWFWQRGGSAKELDAAEAALRRHDPHAARPIVNRVLERNKNDARAHLLAAQIARRSDEYAAAEKHLAVSESASGTAEASRLEWALLGIQQGDFGDDEERMRAAVGRHHAEESAILEALAKGYAAAHRWQDAISALTRLLEREPTHIPALVLRAAVAERFRRHDDAESDLRSAVTAAPNHPAAHAAFADWLNHHGNTREAIAHYERAIELRPDTAARIGLSRALADTGDVTAALKQLDAIPLDDPKSAEVLVDRGRLLLRLKKVGEAEAVLASATKLAPWHRDGHTFRLAALKELGRTADAATCEARVAELDREDSEAGRLKLKARDTPGEPTVRMALHAWSVRNGQPDEEVAWLSEILRAHPKHAPAHAAFADYFDRAGQPRRAALHRALAR